MPTTNEQLIAENPEPVLNSEAAHNPFKSLVPTPENKVNVPSAGSGIAFQSFRGICINRPKQYKRAPSLTSAEKVPNIFPRSDKIQYLSKSLFGRDARLPQEPGFSSLFPTGQIAHITSLFRENLNKPNKLRDFVSNGNNAAANAN